MSKFEKIRAWINRDDGEMYQIGNKKLGVAEVIGYLLCIVAMLVYLLHSKVGFEQTWVGWAALIVGFCLVTWSTSKEVNNEDDIQMK